MIIVHVVGLTQRGLAESCPITTNSADLYEHPLSHSCEQHCFRFAPHTGVPNADQIDALRHADFDVRGSRDETALAAFVVEDDCREVSPLHLPILVSRGVAVGIAIFQQVPITTERAIRQSSVSNRKSTLQLCICDDGIGDVYLREISKCEVNGTQCRTMKRRTFEIGMPEVCVP